MDQAVIWTERKLCKYETCFFLAVLYQGFLNMQQCQKRIKKFPYHGFFGTLVCCMIWKLLLFHICKVIIADKNILDEFYYIVGKTFPGFPVVGVQNCLKLAI